MPSENKQAESRVDRRRLLQLVGTAGAAGMAGCNSFGGGGNGSSGNNQSSGDGGNSNLGERVPEPFVTMATGGHPDTSGMKDFSGVVKDNLQNGFNLKTKVLVPETATAIGNVTNDERVHDLWTISHTTSPTRLDPNSRLELFDITGAGASGSLNWNNYADCEYSNLFRKQRRAGKRKKRQDMVHQAEQLLSKDKAVFPVTDVISNTAIRTDRINVQRSGRLGMIRANVYPFVYSELTQGNSIRVSVSGGDVSGANFLSLASYVPVELWSHFIHSTLIEYNEKVELVNSMASSFESNNDASTYTVELAKGATFHNGDPVTAEDVRFTFKYIWDNPGAAPLASGPDYDSIEILDDRTVEFNFTRSSPTFETVMAPRWGILHSGIWADAPDNPQQFVPNTIVGSGPFEVRDFNQTQYLNLAPSDVHPVHKPDHGLFLKAFSDETTSVQAFNAGEVDVNIGVSFGSVDQIKQNLGDSVKIQQNQGFQPWTGYPNMVKVPMKFPEFREAFGRLLDRTLINELINRKADSALYTSATLFSDGHPWKAPDDMIHKYTEEQAGNPEAAKQMLRNAGWGWDGNNNLRFPADADLSPLWPKGETPQPSNYPCLNSEGEWQYQNNAGSRSTNNSSTNNS